MKMTPEQFIESVVDAYRAARVPVQPHPKLSRGESRAIASETEDRFAYLLITRLRNVDHIFINQTMTSVANGVKERIKPDLVICRAGEIQMLIDLKMDLGYNRSGFPEFMKKVNSLVLKLRGQTFSIWEKIGEKSRRHEKTFSKNARYVFVVMTDQNINKKLFGEVEATASKLDNTAFFVLLRGIHPNVYGQSRDDTVAKVRRHICSESFHAMETLLERA
jgi:hypothetical protein